MTRNHIYLTLATLCVAQYTAFAGPIPVPDGTTISSSPLTIPITKRTHSNASVTPQQLDAHAAYIARKYDHLLEDYERNTGSPFVGVLSTSQRRKKRALQARDGSKGPLGMSVNSRNVPLTYHAEMEFGTPPQKVKVTLDTASSDLWVKGTGCTGQCDGDEFKVEDSTTAAGPVGSDWKISYADGTQSKGLLYRDTVTLFGKKVTGQVLAVVDETYNDQDAIMGMGLAELGTSQWKAAGATTFFQTLLDQSGSSLPGRMFGFCLKPGSSEVAIGGVNPKLIKGDINKDIHWAKVLNPKKPGFWSVKLDSFASSKSQVKLDADRSITMDTASTGIILDIDSVKQFYADPVAVDLHAFDSKAYDEGWYGVPCDGSFGGSLAFAGAEFRINGNNLLLSELPDVSARRGKPYCKSLVYAIPGHDLWIAGDAFLRDYYSVFDVGKIGGAPRFGLAELA